jgi:hypothetical protein
MEITRKIERFLRQNEMPPTTFGRLSVGDPRLVHDMRRGRQFRAPMARRVDDFIAGYRDRQAQLGRSEKA